jgi:hypothetical protein
MTRKIAIVLIALGIFGLVISFGVLIQAQWGAGPYSAGGAIVLAVGVLLYWLSSRNASNESRGANREPASSEVTESRPQLNNAALYVSLIAYLAVTIVATVIMISEGKDLGGLIFLWILFVGFAIFVIARTVSLKDHR